MNKELTAQHLREIVEMFSFSKRLLIWESFKAHISDSTKQVLKDLKIETAIIPGGCTGYVVTFKPLMWYGINPSRAL